MDWLMDDAIAKGAGISLAKMTLQAGEISELHSHPNCNEIIHVLTGKVEQSCGGEKSVLGEGETVLIRQGQKHQTRNISDETAVLMVAYSAGSRLYDPS